MVPSGGSRIEVNAVNALSSLLSRFLFLQFGSFQYIPQHQSILNSDVPLFKPMPPTTSRVAHGEGSRSSLLQHTPRWYCECKNLAPLLAANAQEKEQNAASFV